MIVYLLFLISILVGFKMDNSWYEKSKLQPPNWLFGVIWPLLYLFLFIAYFTIKSKQFGNLLAVAFFLQTLWLLSFNNKYLNISRILLILVVINAYYLFSIAYKENKKVGYLILPYLMWVSFATILNLTIRPKEKNIVN